MYRIATAEQMRKSDSDCMEIAGIPGIVLMENAAQGCVSEIVKDFPDISKKRVACFCGKGNNGSDGTEGAHYKNTFATWCHGPLLPQNPRFCDHILETALCRKYGSVSLEPLDDRAETLSHNEMVERLSQ